MVARIDGPAQHLVDEMNARRTLTLPVFLTSLGIDDLGPTVAMALADHFHTLDALRAQPPATLAEIHGIGETGLGVYLDFSAAIARLAACITCSCETSE